MHILSFAYVCTHGSQIENIMKSPSFLKLRLVASTKLGGRVFYESSFYGVIANVITLETAVKLTKKSEN